MVLVQGIICKVLLGSSQYFTVYSGELQGLAMALNIIPSLTNTQISKATIFFYR